MTHFAHEASQVLTENRGNGGTAVLRKVVAAHEHCTIHSSRETRFVHQANQLLNKIFQVAIRETSEKTDSARATGL